MDVKARLCSLRPQTFVIVKTRRRATERDLRVSNVDPENEISNIDDPRLELIYCRSLQVGGNWWELVDFCKRGDEKEKEVWTCKRAISRPRLPIAT